MFCTTSTTTSLISSWQYGLNRTSEMKNRLMPSFPNPPYSVKWIGSDDPTLINDERFAPGWRSGPKSKADFCVCITCVNYLSPKVVLRLSASRAFFGGAEQKIRQYLVDNNYVETVISLHRTCSLAPPLPSIFWCCLNIKRIPKFSLLMPANYSKRDQQQYPDRCPYRTDYAGICQQGRCCSSGEICRV